ncbi:MAG: Kazal-type serine protease inhibitor [Rhizobiaceae bacterium]
MKHTIPAMIFLLAAVSASPAASLLVDGETVEVPVCGGIAGLQCGSDEWCDFPDSNACGAGDFFGTCRPRPQACTRIYLPVCGCDGETYPNRCEAEAAGVDMLHDGAC